MPNALDKYTLERQLGGGRLSAVFAARDPQGRPVALKRLTNPDAALVANFQREIDLLRRISHPNVVPVLDARTDGEPYYVMPLLDGETLDARVRREGALPLAEACQIVAQVAAALEALHTLGVVHRDVTPANVMVLRDGRAMLIDFSLATIVGTRGQAGVGTPLYCAPEQWAGDVPTPSADVYALGGVAYFALSGRAPYAERETAEQTAAQHMRERMRPLHHANRAVPRAVSDVVMRALARQPWQRWGTVGEFARQLEAAAGSPRSIHKRKPSPLPAMGVIGAVAGLASLALIAGAWLALTPEAPALRPAPALLPSPTVTLQPLPSPAQVESPSPAPTPARQPTNPPRRVSNIKPSVTPLPELEGRRGAAESAASSALAQATPTPRTTRTPRINVNLDLSGVSGQERWGTPMGADGCSPPFNDRQPVWRYKVTLTIRNAGTAPLTNWSVRLFNQSTPLHTCPLYGSYEPIQPGETRQLEVAAFLRTDPAVQAHVISGNTVWRLCFQGTRGVPC